MTDELERTYARMGAVARIANRGGLSLRDRALVRILRSSMCYRANKMRALGGSDAHAKQSAVSVGERPGSHGPDVRHGPGGRVSDHPVRAGADTAPRVSDSGRDPAHDLRRYNAASGMIAHFADVLPAENLAELRAIKDQLEDQQAANDVRRAVNASLRRW